MSGQGYSGLVCFYCGEPLLRKEDVRLAEIEAAALAVVSYPAPARSPHNDEPYYVVAGEVIERLRAALTGGE